MSGRVAGRLPCSTFTLACCCRPLIQDSDATPQACYEGLFNKDDEQDVALTGALKTLEKILVPVIRYETSNNESKKGRRAG